MAVVTTMSVHAGETEPIIFPLTLNGNPMDLTGVTSVTMVKSGLDGKLAGTLVSGSTVSVYDTLGGLVEWEQSASDLDDRYSPYRIYFRLYGADGKYTTAPREGHFLLFVASDYL